MLALRPTNRQKCCNVQRASVFVLKKVSVNNGYKLLRFFIWLYYNRFRTSVLTAESCLYIQPTGTISENYKCSHVWLIIKRLARNTIKRLTLYTIRTRRIFRLFTRFIRVLCYLASLCCNRKQKNRKRKFYEAQ